MASLRPSIAALTTALGLCAAVPSAHAAALTVAPILIEAAAPARSAMVTLRNRDARPIDVQVRVFAWTQRDGEDLLEPTTAVVASPPIVQIGPNGSNVVRLQRVAPGEPAREEAYRVVVDELPNLNRTRNGAIAVLLRYSIPMFFGDADASPPKLAWSVGAAAGRPALSAVNDGDKRVQISALTIKAGVRVWPVAPGLSGYVLGHSTRRWVIPGSPALGHARIAAGSDHGPINAALAP